MARLNRHEEIDKPDFTGLLFGVPEAMREEAYKWSIVGTVAGLALVCRGFTIALILALMAWSLPPDIYTTSGRTGLSKASAKQTTPCG